MSTPENPDRHRDRHNIQTDERGQDQPTDKSRAQQVTHGEEAEREAKEEAGRRRKAASHGSTQRHRLQK
jgi:hypothetical protein